MKRMLLTIALTFSSAFALAQSDTVDYKIEMRAKYLNDLVMQRMHTRLAQPQKVELLRGINALIMAMEMTNPVPSPVPNPVPNPTPVPTPIPQPMMSTTTIMIETTPIIIQAMSAGELYTKCMTQAYSYNHSADDVTVTVGNSQTISSHSNGYFTTEQMCTIASNAFINAMNTNPMSVSSQIYLNVSGSIETTPFNFSATSKADVLAQCAAAAKKYNNSADDLTVFVNNAAPKKYHASGWYSANQLCALVMNSIDSVIP